MGPTPGTPPLQEAWVPLHLAQRSPRAVAQRGQHEDLGGGIQIYARRPPEPGMRRESRLQGRLSPVETAAADRRLIDLHTSDPNLEETRYRPAICLSWLVISRSPVRIRVLAQFIINDLIQSAVFAQKPACRSLAVFAVA